MGKMLTSACMVGMKGRGMHMCHLAQTSIISTHANGAKATYTEGESPNGSDRYCYDYSDEELAQFVPIIKAAEREGKKVQVILMVVGQRMG